MRLANVVLALIFFCGTGFAAPGGSAERTARVGKNETAERHYKNGLRHRDAAWVYEEKMSGTKDEKDRQAYAKFIHQTYLRALGEFEKAVAADPEFYQAFSSLGYVRRKTGDLDAGLEAYNQALKLNPTYSEAIEYRAEAYLELGRIDDMKQAYGILVSLSKPHADRLLTFVDGWVESQDTESIQADLIPWVKEKRKTLGKVDEWIEKW